VSIVYVDGRPVCVPDAVINRLLVIEAETDEGLGLRRIKRSRGKRGRSDSWTGVVTISTKGFDEAMGSVDSSVRISALHTALGLAL